VLDRYNSGSDPEVAARSIADRYEADDVTIQVESEDNGEAVVYVTALGLYDDSVRDERLRLLYRDNGVGTWELVDAGRQVRCWAGRGHEGWGAEACR
jgi:nucleoside-diphosphate-sugar epimerase